MASKRFAVLVDSVARAFGQEGRQLKETPEAIYLRTPDGLVYAFFEDAAKLTPALVKGLSVSLQGDLSRLVILSLSPLLPSSAEALEEASASLVTGERFHRLLQGLELTGYVEEDGPAGRARAEASPGGSSTDGGERRVLPTAVRLDETMERARTWMSWGVPAIALRFFEEASRLKPEFTPATLGRGSALAMLGAADQSEAAFEQVLAQAPGELEARIGLARVTGLRGDLEGEVEELTALLKEDPSRAAVRASLVAALAPLGKWKEVRVHLEAFLEIAPQDAWLHAAASVCLEHLGSKEEASREKRAAEALGMSAEAWKRLREQLETPVKVPRKRGSPKEPAPGRSR